MADDIEENPSKKSSGKAGMKRKRSNGDILSSAKNFVSISDLQWLESINMACCAWDHTTLNRILKQRSRKSIERLENKRLHRSITHPLYVAAKHNNYEAIETLVQAGFHVNYTNKQGVSALYIACHYGHAFIVDLLCRLGASVDLAKSDGATCLYSACKHGQLEAVKALVKYGADIRNSTHKGFSFLHVAAQYGHPQIAEYLLQNKFVNINAKTPANHTPLQIACFQQHLDVVNVLLKWNCEIIANSEESGWPETHIASQLGNLELFKALGNHLKRRNDIPSDWINMKKHDDQQTPLLTACKAGASETFLRYLIAQDADPYVTLPDGTTACMLLAKVGTAESLLYLLEICGENENRKQNSQGWNLLHTACRFNRVEIARSLLNYDSSLLDISANNGMTPLYLAAKHGKLEIAKVLVNEFNCDVNQQTSSQATALYTACKHGKLEIVQFLVERGASINIANTRGCTPFLTACNHNHLHVIEYLVHKLGPSLALSRGSSGWTGLHIASRLGYIDQLRFLCEQLKDRIDLSKLTEDGGGYNPLHIAAYHGHLNVVRYLVAEMDIPTDIASVKLYTASYLARKRQKKTLCEWLLHAREWNKLEMLCDSRKYEEIERMFREGLTGPNPFRLTNFYGENALTIVSRGPLSTDNNPSPWLPVCARTKGLVIRASKPFNPGNAELYPPTVRKGAIALLLVLRRIGNLPLPVQWNICAFYAER